MFLMSKLLIADRIQLVTYVLLCGLILDRFQFPDDLVLISACAGDLCSNG